MCFSKQYVCRAAEPRHAKPGKGVLGGEPLCEPRQGGAGPMVDRVQEEHVDATAQERVGDPLARATKVPRVENTPACLSHTRGR